MFVEPWTDIETNYLKNNYLKHNNYELATVLNRSESSVSNKLNKLKLIRPKNKIEIGDVFGNLKAVKSFLKKVFDECKYIIEGDV